MQKGEHGVDIDCGGIDHSPCSTLLATTLESDCQLDELLCYFGPTVGAVFGNELENDMVLLFVPWPL